MTENTENSTKKSGPFYVASVSIVKFNTGATEQYSPRTENKRINSVSGPFKKRRQAEEFANRIIGVVQAQIITYAGVVRLSQDPSTDPRVQADMKKALNL